MAEQPVSPQPVSSGRSVRRNIETVAKLEEEFIRSRSLADRAADAIGSFTGSIWFVTLHVVVLGSWMAVNLGVVPGVRPFDPFPFMLLNMAVSVEAIFLSTFVLMKQNRMSRRSEQREHLDLQINLLAEREMTLALNMLRGLSSHLGVHLSTEELDDLSKETSVEAVASELKEKLPEEK